MLNIYSDHIDRHSGFENYKNAKLNILKGSAHNIVRDEVVDAYALDKKILKKLAVSIFWHAGDYSYTDKKFFANKKNVFDNEWILLQGEHNMMNICAVIGVCEYMNIDMEILQKTLKTFNGLPHRMEKIWTYGGIIWIDDAISTTPESTIQAIKTFKKDVDTIFLWWTDRGYIFDDLIKILMAYNIRNVVLFPDSGKRIFKAIKEKDNGEIRIFKTDDMKEAIKFAYKYTKLGKICLLSTASPSYSLRKNFEEKWDLFKKHIKDLS